MSFRVFPALASLACLALLAGCGSALNGNMLAGKSDATETADAAGLSPADSTLAAPAKKAITPPPPPAFDASNSAAPAGAPIEGASAAAAKANAEVTGTTTYLGPTPRRLLAEPPPVSPGMQDPMDDLVVGKRQFQDANYALAEKHFRRVVEQDNIPAQRKAEAWVGLAASYDRLKRFELADRAYRAAIGILGPTPEILNNQGFSYMLRGDYLRARAKLTQALDLDPTNPYIQNNIDALEKSMRGDGGRKKL
jgi:tetratricopeptide (TPR) repeat protein